MSEIKNIDELFKAKLANSTPVAYSETAWMGANQLLNNHFKWLFVKQLLWWTLPVLLIGGISTGIYVQSSSTEVQAIGQVEIGPEKNIDHIVKAKLSSAPSTYTAEKSMTLSNRDESTQAEAVRPNNSSKAASVLIGQDLVKSSIATAKGAIGNNQTSGVLAVNQAPVALQAIPQPPNHSAAKTTHSSINTTPAAYAPTSMMSTDMAKYKLSSSIRKIGIAKLPSIFDAYQNEDIQSSNSESPLIQELRKLQIAAEFGVLTGSGFHALNGKTMAPGFGLHGQLLTKYHLGQSVYLNLGLGLFNRSSLTKNTAFTGQANSKIDITPLTLNYASIMVGVGYRIGARHSIGGGMQFNPLISVLARKEKTNSGESASTASYINDKNGFYSLDAAFVINYQFALAERLDATAGIQFGFMDATDNSIFKSGDINDFNRMLKLGLSYRLTQR